MKNVKSKEYHVYMTIRLTNSFFPPHDCFDFHEIYITNITEKMAIETIPTFYKWIPPEDIETIEL